MLSINWNETTQIHSETDIMSKWKPRRQQPRDFQTSLTVLLLPSINTRSLFSMHVKASARFELTADSVRRGLPCWFELVFILQGNFASDRGLVQIARHFRPQGCRGVKRAIGVFHNISGRYVGPHATYKPVKTNLRTFLFKTLKCTSMAARGLCRHVNLS